jgi:bifunctional non-homologous end joining protein LigD
MPTSRLLPPADIKSERGLPLIQPITLQPGPEPFDDPDWVFEPKYDGFRGVVYATSRGCEIRSRRDIALGRFRGLWERVAEVLGGREVILDGEIVSLNRQGKPVFDNLIRGRGFVAYAAFDLLWLDGRDLRNRPLAERKEELASLLPEDTGPLYKILTVDEYGRALFSATRKLDLEGVVAKRKDEGYGAGTIWYKIGNPGYRAQQARSEPFQRGAIARR